MTVPATCDHREPNSKGFSRRRFITQTSCFGAFYALAQTIPLPSLAETIGIDTRVSATPLVDKGFASVRKVGNGLYATISDPSKGMTTICNGGFLVGKDGALLIEGFGSTAGASFQMETLRSVTQVPVKSALDTHYHFDHSMGNSFYGANGVPLWAHAAVARRMVESYSVMQGADRAAVLGPLEKELRGAKSDAERQHLQGDLNALTGLFQIANSSVIALPNRPIDPAKLPMTIDLGGLSAVIESYPGHSGTDIIVRVPEQNVVYAGDLLFSGWYPVAFDEKATISGWRSTLAKFAAFDKDTLFVPDMANSVGKKVSLRSAKSLMTSHSKRKSCSRRVCPFRKPHTATPSRTSSRTSRSMPGVSPSDPRSPSSMPNGKPNRSWVVGQFELTHYHLAQTLAASARNNLDDGARRLPGRTRTGVRT
jgi:glyoxylase-like metal-dependent hydrolase (beta-lactamase superfamily II)